MSDIRERLRRSANASIYGGWGAAELAWLHEAADIIDKLVDALKPYACTCPEGECSVATPYEDCGAEARDAINAVKGEQQ